MSLPSRIGPYRVLRLLGGGGFSEVLLGQDTRPERGGAKVAIKRVRPDLRGADPMYRRSIVQEGRVAQAVTIPNLARIDALMNVDGEPVVVMEYVEGFGVDRLLCRVAGKGLVPWVVAEIGCQLAAALRGLHCAQIGGQLGGEVGYVHQDLKPSNIRLNRRGVVKLLDLGIAAPIRRPLRRIRQGTPGYRSPEQVAGARRLEAASDLYALGILLYELCTGRRLFPESVCHDVERVTAAQRQVVARVRSGSVRLPAGLIPLLSDLLAFEVGERVVSAAETERRLSQWRQELGGRGDFSRWAREAADRLSADTNKDRQYVEPGMGQSMNVAVPKRRAVAEALAAKRHQEDSGLEGPPTLPGLVVAEPGSLSESAAALLASAVLLAVFVGGVILGVNTHPNRFGSLPPITPDVAHGQPVVPASVAVERAMEVRSVGEEGR